MERWGAAAADVACVGSSGTPSALLGCILWGEGKDGGVAGDLQLSSGMPYDSLPPASRVCGNETRIGSDPGKGRRGRRGVWWRCVEWREGRWLVFVCLLIADCCTTDCLNSADNGGMRRRQMREGLLLACCGVHSDSTALEMRIAIPYAGHPTSPPVWCLYPHPSPSPPRFLFRAVSHAGDLSAGQPCHTHARPRGGLLLGCFRFGQASCGLNLRG